MTTTPLSPKRLAEIAKLRDNAIGYHQRAMADLIDEVARLQSAVDRLANAERDLAETQLVLEQQDRDLERLRAEVTHWREARRIAVEAGEVLVRQRDERNTRNATETAESVAETLDHIAAARARIDELEAGPSWAELRRLRKLADAAARAHDARDQIDESAARRIAALEDGLREACGVLDDAGGCGGTIMKLRALAEGVQFSKETT